MTPRVRFGIVVRKAEFLDAPAIAAMRKEWYDENGMPIVAVPEVATWFIGETALVPQRVIACMAVIPGELNPNGDTFVTDLYCEKGTREGKLGIKAFLEKLDELPGRKLASAPINNLGIQKVFESAGYRAIEVVLAKGEPCPAQLDPSSAASLA